MLETVIITRLCDFVNLRWVPWERNPFSCSQTYSAIVKTCPTSYCVCLWDGLYKKITKDFNIGQIYRSHGVVTAPSPPLLVGVLLLGATQFSSDSMTALHTRTVQPVDGCGFLASNKVAVLVKLLCSQSMWSFLLQSLTLHCTAGVSRPVHLYQSLKSGKKEPWWWFRKCRMFYRTER